MRSLIPLSLSCCLLAFGRVAGGNSSGSSVIGGSASPLSFGPSHASLRAGGLKQSVGGGSRSDSSWIDLMTVPEVAGAMDGLKLLAAAWDETGLTFKLEQSRHLTILMPTDRAMKRRSLDRILPCLSYDTIDRIFQSMIIPEVFKASEMIDGDYPVTAASGMQLILRVERPSDEVAAIANLTAIVAADGALPVVLQESSAPASTSTSSSSFANVVTPVLQVMQDGRIIGSADGHFIDTANGVGYAIDGIPIFPDLEEELQQAKKRCANRPVNLSDGGIVGLTADHVPPHIQVTSRSHAAWGRRQGGAPPTGLFFSDSQPDVLDLSHQFNLRGAAQQHQEDQQAKQEQLTTIGVIVPKKNPQVQGVIGRRR